MYCGNCRTELLTDSDACPLCGVIYKRVSAVRPQIVYEEAGCSDERVCPNCGAKIAVGSAFCGSCGNKIVIPKGSRMPKCVVCGSVLTPSAKFCVECRTEYREDKDGYISLPQEIGCSICGAEISNDSDYCVKCGSKIDRNSSIVKMVIPCCSECGAEVNPSNLFCTECGKKWCLGDAKRTVIPIMLTDSLAFGDKVQCPVCGQVQLSDRKICMNCSIKFE